MLRTSVLQSRSASLSVASRRLRDAPSRPRTTASAAVFIRTPPKSTPRRRPRCKNAAKECKAERADADFPATHDGKSFQEFYGTGKHGKNAYGKCVSTKARALKAKEDEADKADVSEFKNAAKQCQAESTDPDFPAAHDGKSFSDFYGTNHNHRNAFGKCVSGKAGEDHYTDPMDDEGDSQDDHGHGQKDHDPDDA